MMAVPVGPRRNALVIDTRFDLQEEGYRFLAWVACKNDRDLAAILGVSQPAATKWRVRRGLPAKGSKGGLGRTRKPVGPKGSNSPLR